MSYKKHPEDYVWFHLMKNIIVFWEKTLGTAQN
jgi:hypothetical protein